MSPSAKSIKSFNRQSRRFTTEMERLYLHPICPEHVRELIEFFNHGIKTGLSFEARARDMRFSALFGLIQISRVLAFPFTEASDNSNERSESSNEQR